MLVTASVFLELTVMQRAESSSLQPVQVHIVLRGPWKWGWNLNTTCSQQDHLEKGEKEKVLKWQPMASSESGEILKDLNKKRFNLIKKFNKNKYTLFFKNTCSQVSGAHSLRCQKLVECRLYINHFYIAPENVSTWFFLLESSGTLAQWWYPLPLSLE